MTPVSEKVSVFKPVSRCLYCNSTSYGKGCRFAPKGVHFHPQDPKKCSYCGSTSYGKGCKLNPFSDIHLHGIDYNKMFNESMKNETGIGIKKQANKDNKTPFEVLHVPQKK